MSKEQSKQFLEQMLELVRNGQRSFVRRTRNGKSYIQMLADLGLTSIDEAWECVLNLNDSHYYDGPDFDRDDPSAGQVIWIFKMDINGTMTYIKLKDETSKRGCVCLSFHEDEP
jgi:hypothetical protein